MDNVSDKNEKKWFAFSKENRKMAYAGVVENQFVAEQIPISRRKKLDVINLIMWIQNVFSVFSMFIKFQLEKRHVQRQRLFERNEKRKKNDFKFPSLRFLFT